MYILYYSTYHNAPSGLSTTPARASLKGKREGNSPMPGKGMEKWVRRVRTDPHFSKSYT